MKLDRCKLISKTGLLGLFLFLSVVSENTLAQTGLENRLDPKLLYDQMLSSPRFYNYSGILTYEQGGQLQSFRVESTISDGSIEKNLELLDGPASSHSLSFDSGCKKRAAVSSESLSPYYNFYTRGETRIAGLDGIEIVLSPVDKYRNGYQYVIDKSTGLMLRSVTLTPDRRMVERLQYAQLSFEQPEMPEQEDLSAEVDLGQIELQLSEEPVLEELPSSPHKVSCDQLSIENGWAAGWVPDGFETLDTQLEEGRAILVYGDGISTFSIFIDTVLEGFLPPSNAQRGATTVYINYLSDQSSTYLVSIVGEIPFATAERVLATLRRK